MKYRPFGNPGIMVSEVGFGSNTISGQGTLGVVDETQGAAAVQRAYESGITFFDTAEAYSEGRSEEVLGRVLGNKSDVVICSKVGANAGAITPKRISIAAEASLRRLRRDAIDVYLLHNPTTEQVQDPTIQEALESLVKDGRIRSYGVSLLLTDQVGQGNAVVKEGGYSSMQMTMNFAERETEDTVLPNALTHGVGIIIRVPLGSGILSGKYTADSQFPENDRRNASRPEVKKQMDSRMAYAGRLRELAEADGVSMVHAALGWLLSHPAVSVVIPGAKNPAQAEDNAAASEVVLSSAFLEGAKSLP